jgi:hypothetical protein
MPDEIEIEAFTIERTSIKTTREEFDAARESEGLGNEYDVWLSDMDGETVVIAPDGTVLNPYGSATDLLALIKPILAQVPTWQVEQYAMSRRSDEE